MVRSFVLAMLVVSSVTRDAAADDTDGWPQFRGPDGQGHVSGVMPSVWDETKNKAWEVAVPGKAWSSPVIGAGKIWLTTAIPEKGGGHVLRALAFDQQSGKLLHDVELLKVAKTVKLHDRNSPSTPTPVLDGGRLYASFGSDGVVGVDTAAAKVVWKNESFKLDYETGAASSPVVYKNLLILPCDAGDAQFAVALKTDTGEIAWKTDRLEAKKKGPTSRRAFSTPLVITANGQDQVVMPGAYCIYAYDPATGAELWRVATPGFSNVPRPIFAHGLVYATTGFTPPELIAIRPDGKGDVTKTHVVWRYKKNVPNVPSPIVVGDHVFMISDQGIATCLDAKTGALKWFERLSAGNFSASPLARGNVVYAFSDDGKTALFEAADTFKELGRNEMPGRVQATPAVAGGSLFIRTDKALVKVSEAK